MTYHLLAVNLRSDLRNQPPVRRFVTMLLRRVAADMRAS